MITRKAFLAGLGATSLSLTITPASAQADYPSRPIRVVIGFPAGSGADILGRWFTEKLAQVSGATVIVDNKPGGNSNIAIGYAANQKPDGYTVLFVANSNMAFSRFLFKDLPFDTVKDFIPAASFAQIAFVITVGGTSPHKNLADLSKALKAKNQNKYGSTNQTALIASEAYKQSIGGFDGVNVPYRTAPEALPDVENNTLDFMVMDGTFATGPIKAGKIRALAVTTNARIPFLPDVPTMKEAGIPDYEFAPWWGAYVPKGTPDAIVAKVGGWMNQVSKLPETKEFLERVASTPMWENSEQVKKRLQDDIARLGPVIVKAKMEPQ